MPSHRRTAPWSSAVIQRPASVGLTCCAGLIPSWTKDLKAARAQPINGRSETASTSGMFKTALAQRRCLVPADAFYEWEARPDGKQPYAIARRDGSPLAFAGLWEWWKAPDGSLLRTFAILTTSANTTMRQLHERMPVILEPDALRRTLTLPYAKLSTPQVIKVMSPESY